MQALRWANLILAALAVLPAAAHVLELPSKLTLNRPLWLAVQQLLYRGWGPFYGAPVEIGALLTSVALLVSRRRDPVAWRATVIATAAYIGMLAAFFIFNQPVNQAFAQWTPASLPPDWPAYRRQWETGHAVAFVFSVVGLVAVARGWLIDRDRSARPRRLHA